MHLTLRERERIDIFNVAQLARRRLSRGQRLNGPEAVAVVCDEILELAWDGLSLPQVMEAARHVLAPEQLRDGVAELVPQIQVEALFPHGTSLVAIDLPFGAPATAGPGARALAEGTVELNAGRTSWTVTVRNTGPLPVHVSSHFPFAEVNSALSFDREAARGSRLGIPAGTSETFEPGSIRDVELIALSLPAPADDYHQGTS
ncbi:urease subunit beta [Streptomyces sp. NPDC048253]|uniref:urease subunit beta n=1 Tax=Streptomyces sp. NPDC048253 TaxID=3365524 RepID=UPI00371907F2